MPLRFRAGRGAGGSPPPSAARAGATPPVSPAAAAHRRAHPVVVTLVLALGSLVACGGGDDGPASDSGVVRLDGELPDVPRPPLDALPSGETGPGDTGDLDGARADGGPMAADGGGAADAATPEGGPDPSATCSAVVSRYATVLEAARSCERDAECNQLVCDGPCCTCRVHIRGGAGDELALLLAEFEAAGCYEDLACPGFECGAPTGVVCYRGACMTSRTVPVGD